MGDSMMVYIIRPNNHYAGFGPGTFNMFRKMVGLEEVTWKNKKNCADSDNVIFDFGFLVMVQPTILPYYYHLL
jgi:hypothetical protein